MKGETVAGLVLALVVALVVVLGLVVWLVGAETLRLLLIILSCGLVGVGLLFGVALVVRAWRKNDAPPIERQVIRETRIIDHGPVTPQLPSQPAFGVFPELLLASWRAGQLTAQEGRGEVVDAQVRTLPPRAQGWSGDITP